MPGFVRETILKAPQDYKDYSASKATLLFLKAIADKVTDLKIENLPANITEAKNEQESLERFVINFVIPDLKIGKYGRITSHFKGAELTNFLNGNGKRYLILAIGEAYLDTDDRILHAGMLKHFYDNSSLETAKKENVIFQIGELIQEKKATLDDLTNLEIAQKISDEAIVKALITASIQASMTFTPEQKAELITKIDKVYEEWIKFKEGRFEFEKHILVFLKIGARKASEAPAAVSHRASPSSAPAAPRDIKNFEDKKAIGVKGKYIGVDLSAIETLEGYIRDIGKKDKEKLKVFIKSMKAIEGGKYSKKKFEKLFKDLLSSSSDSIWSDNTNQKAALAQLTQLAKNKDPNLYNDLVKIFAIVALQEPILEAFDSIVNNDSRKPNEERKLAYDLTTVFANRSQSELHSVIETVLSHYSGGYTSFKDSYHGFLIGQHELYDPKASYLIYSSSYFKLLGEKVKFQAKVLHDMPNYLAKLDKKKDEDIRRYISVLTNLKKIATHNEDKDQNEILIGYFQNIAFGTFTYTELVKDRAFMAKQKAKIGEIYKKEIKYYENQILDVVLAKEIDTLQQLVPPRGEGEGPRWSVVQGFFSDIKEMFNFIITDEDFNARVKAAVNARIKELNSAKPSAPKPAAAGGEGKEPAISPEASAAIVALKKIIQDRKTEEDLNNFINKLNKIELKKSNSDKYTALQDAFTVLVKNDSTVTFNSNEIAKTNLDLLQSLSMAPLIDDFYQAASNKVKELLASALSSGAAPAASAPAAPPEFKDAELKAINALKKFVNESKKEQLSKFIDFLGGIDSKKYALSVTYSAVESAFRQLTPPDTVISRRGMRGGGGPVVQNSLQIALQQLQVLKRGDVPIDFIKKTFIEIALNRLNPASAPASPASAPAAAPAPPKPPQPSLPRQPTASTELKTNFKELKLSRPYDQSEETKRGKLGVPYKKGKDYLKSFQVDGKDVAGLCEIQAERVKQEDSLMVDLLPDFKALTKEKRAEVFKTTFAQMQTDHASGEIAKEVGSTGNVSVAWIDETKGGERKLTVTNANLGDSATIRVILDEKNHLVSTTLINKLHNTKNVDERLWATQQGIEFKDFTKTGLGWRVKGQHLLEVTRSFGDLDDLVKEVSHIPEVTEETFLLEPGQRAFIVTACDGLTDAMDANRVSQIVADNVRRNISPAKTAEALVDSAYKERPKDNISVAFFEVGSQPISAAVFDGHGGPEISQAIGENFYPALKKHTKAAMPVDFLTGDLDTEYKSLTSEQRGKQRYDDFKFDLKVAVGEPLYDALSYIIEDKKIEASLTTYLQNNTLVADEKFATALIDGIAEAANINGVQKALSHAIKIAAGSSSIGDTKEILDSKLLLNMLDEELDLKQKGRNLIATASYRKFIKDLPNQLISNNFSEEMKDSIMSYIVSNESFRDQMLKYFRNKTLESAGIDLFSKKLYKLLIDLPRETKPEHLRQAMVGSFSVFHEHQLETTSFDSVIPVDSFDDHAKNLLGKPRYEKYRTNFFIALEENTVFPQAFKDAIKALLNHQEVSNLLIEYFKAHEYPEDASELVTAFRTMWEVADVNIENNPSIIKKVLTEAFLLVDINISLNDISDSVVQDENLLGYPRYSRLLSNLKRVVDKIGLPATNMLREILKQSNVKHALITHFNKTNLPPDLDRLGDEILSELGKVDHDEEIAISQALVNAFNRFLGIDSQTGVKIPFSDAMYLDMLEGVIGQCIPNARFVRFKNLLLDDLKSLDTPGTQNVTSAVRDYLEIPNVERQLRDYFTKNTVDDVSVLKNNLVTYLSVISNDLVLFRNALLTAFKDVEITLVDETFNTKITKIEERELKLLGDIRYHTIIGQLGQADDELTRIITNFLKSPSVQKAFAHCLRNDLTLQLEEIYKSLEKELASKDFENPAELCAALVNAFRSVGFDDLQEDTFNEVIIHEGGGFSENAKQLLAIARYERLKALLPELFDEAITDELQKYVDSPVKEKLIEYFKQNKIPNFTNHFDKILGEKLGSVAVENPGQIREALAAAFNEVKIPIQADEFKDAIPDADVLSEEQQNLIGHLRYNQFMHRLEDEDEKDWNIALVEYLTTEKVKNNLVEWFKTHTLPPSLEPLKAALRDQLWNIGKDDIGTLEKRLALAFHAGRIEIDEDAFNGVAGAKAEEEGEEEAKQIFNAEDQHLIGTANYFKFLQQNEEIISNIPQLGEFLHNPEIKAALIEKWSWAEDAEYPPTPERLRELFDEIASFQHEDADELADAIKGAFQDAFGIDEIGKDNVLIGNIEEEEEEELGLRDLFGESKEQHEELPRHKELKALHGVAKYNKFVTDNRAILLRNKKLGDIIKNLKDDLIKHWGDNPHLQPRPLSELFDDLDHGATLEEAGDAFIRFFGADNFSTLANRIRGQLTDAQLPHILSGITKEKGVATELSHIENATLRKLINDTVVDFGSDAKAIRDAVDILNKSMRQHEEDLNKHRRDHKDQIDESKEAVEIIALLPVPFDRAGDALRKNLFDHMPQIRDDQAAVNALHKAFAKTDAKPEDIVEDKATSPTHKALRDTLIKRGLRIKADAKPELRRLKNADYRINHPQFMQLLEPVIDTGSYQGDLSKVFNRQDFIQIQMHHNATKISALEVNQTHEDAKSLEQLANQVKLLEDMIRRQEEKFSKLADHQVIREAVTNLDYEATVNDGLRQNIKRIIEETEKANQKLQQLLVIVNLYSICLLPNAKDIDKDLSKAAIKGRLIGFDPNAEHARETDAMVDTILGLLIEEKQLTATTVARQRNGRVQGGRGRLTERVRTNQINIRKLKRIQIEVEKIGNHIRGGKNPTSDAIYFDQWSPSRVIPSESAELKSVIKEELDKFDIKQAAGEIKPGSLYGNSNGILAEGHMQILYNRSDGSHGVLSNRQGKVSLDYFLGDSPNHPRSIAMLLTSKTAAALSDVMSEEDVQKLWSKYREKPITAAGLEKFISEQIINTDQGQLPLKGFLEEKLNHGLFNNIYKSLVTQYHKERTEKYPSGIVLPKPDEFRNARKAVRTEFAHTKGEIFIDGADQYTVLAMILVCKQEGIPCVNRSSFYRDSAGLNVLKTMSAAMNHPSNTDLQLERDAYDRQKKTLKDLARSTPERDVEIGATKLATQLQAYDQARQNRPEEDARHRPFP